MSAMHSLLRLGTGALARVGRGIAGVWHAARHPKGWYDEVNEVYGTSDPHSPRKSAGTAGLGGHISGGGG